MNDEDFKEIEKTDKRCTTCGCMENCFEDKKKGAKIYIHDITKSCVVVGGKEK